MLQDKRIKPCISVFDSAVTAVHSAHVQSAPASIIQLLLAANHFMGAHAEALRQTDDSNSSSNDGKNVETEATLHRHQNQFLHSNP